MPLLGLVTVAALFPENDWHLKVIDMNVEALTEAGLGWADYVFTSTMIVQKNSFYEVVRRCNQLHVPRDCRWPSGKELCHLSRWAALQP